MPQYSVPGDLEITNKEKKNYNGCNGLASNKRALKWDHVSPLQCYGHLLEQVGGLSLIITNINIINIIIIPRTFWENLHEMSTNVTNTSTPLTGRMGLFGWHVGERDGLKLKE